jgi:hypothetical protein
VKKRSRAHEKKTVRYFTDFVIRKILLAFLTVTFKLEKFLKSPISFHRRFAQHEISMLEPCERHKNSRSGFPESRALT